MSSFNWYFFKHTILCFSVKRNKNSDFCLLDSKSGVVDEDSSSSRCLPEPSARHPLGSAVGEEADYSDCNSSGSSCVCQSSSASCVSSSSSIASDTVRNKTRTSTAPENGFEILEKQYFFV